MRKSHPGTIGQQSNVDFALCSKEDCKMHLSAWVGDGSLMLCEGARVELRGLSDKKNGRHGTVKSAHEFWPVCFIVVVETDEDSGDECDGIGLAVHPWNLIQLL